MQVATRPKTRTPRAAGPDAGQHLALVVAAQLARTQLFGDAPNGDSAAAIEEAVGAIAAALARVAPLYVQDGDPGVRRQLAEAELEGSQVLRRPVRLVLKDGRALSSVSIKRVDLRQAIAVLRATGIPELGAAARNGESEQAAPRDRVTPLREQLEEIERLLHPPLLPQQTQRANKLAIALARSAPDGRISNLAMRLMSALHDAGSDGSADGVPMIMARLRAAVDEATLG